MGLMMIISIKAMLLNMKKGLRFKMCLAHNFNTMSKWLCRGWKRGFGH